MIWLSDEISREHNSRLLKELRHSFSIDIRVDKSTIDGFGHVNNAVYIQWLDQVHWSHLNELGISNQMIRDERCGFVVHHTDVTYRAPLLENEIVKIGTSIIYFDERYKMKRQFQLVRVRDRATVFTGTIDYISVDLATGRPKRLPDSFVSAITTHDTLGE